ncbi:hypothetical protein BHE74_00005479 [Ensete ventricosum]|nr:hypothetical protein BHE74_00005479 [Ensete ventricosum]
MLRTSRARRFCTGADRPVRVSVARYHYALSITILYGGRGRFPRSNNGAAQSFSLHGVKKQKVGGSREAFRGSRGEGFAAKNAWAMGVLLSEEDSSAKASWSTSIQDLCRTRARSEDEPFQALFMIDLPEEESVAKQRAIELEIELVQTKSKLKESEQRFKEAQ